MMRVTWNGTGSAWAPFFGNASALVESEGQRLLVDCGHTAPGRLLRTGVALEEINTLFISHLHGDHIYGLEEWGFKSYLLWKKRPYLLIAEELIAPLWENVLSGTMGSLVPDTGLEGYFQVVPLQTGKIYQHGPWTLEIHPVRHVPNVPAYGIRIRADNTALGFTCDTLADADTWFYDDTRLVFHDCTFWRYFPTTVHAHFEQLVEYPAALREHTCLIHYDDAVREKLEDPVWRQQITATGMRLIEPFVPIEVE